MLAIQFYILQKLLTRQGCIISGDRPRSRHRASTITAQYGYVSMHQLGLQALRSLYRLILVSEILLRSLKE